MMMKFAMGVVFAGALVSTASAADVISVRYDISFGGARVMKADYSATLGEKDYSASLEAKTVGVSKWLSKIKISMSANGALAGSTLRPQAYNYLRKKNDKRKERALSFSPDGALVTAGADYGKSIETAVNNKVMDPLTMLLKLSRADKPCSGKHRAFDGRDVFDISLSGGKGPGTLNCKMVYTPIAGSDVDDGDTDPVTYELSLAPYGNKGYVPVRIAGTSKGVGFEVTAASVSVNGAAVSY